MANEKKNVWNVIFDNFKALYPRMSKMANGYKPFVYPMIVVKLSDGTMVFYDDGWKKAQFVKEGENLYKYI